ncbi:MAG TPA: hypothetical protein VNP96_06050 [Solirubrobacterales bacterium]|nr:hypothetical protein [Solirubrobacterales bacterium]
MQQRDEPDAKPPPAGWWESWSVAAIAILVAVVAITVLVIALLAGMLGDR